MGTTNPCRSFIGAFLFCLLIANGLYAKEQCKKGCPTADSGKLKFQPGNLYEYNFDSIVTISVTGTDTDETSLKVLGHANIYASPNCEYTLTLDKVVITATKESLRKQATQDIAKPVQFTLSSGILEPQICVEESDSDYSINIKRAIISMLQSSEKDHETDVFGVCPTATKVTNVAGVNVVTKVRNLNACGYRETVSNGLISGIVNEHAGVKSSSLLTGDYTKEQKINNGIIESVELHEEYRFVPTSTGNAGVNAKVKTNMKLVKQGPGAAPQVNGIPKSIIFRHPRPVPAKNIEALKKVFESTVNHVDGYTKADAATIFTELIRLMRTADSDTLTDLSGIAHPNKNLAKKVYFDALFRTGTSEAVKAIVQQIPKMSEMEKRIAFLSFNLVENVDKNALTKAASLLNPGAPKEAYLAVGNLVSKYCQEHSCDDNEINAISKKFGDSLKQCKASTHAEEDRIIFALKGIRNTHKIANSAVGPLTECTGSDRSARIRVAALQAFTAAGCNPDLQQKALSILSDRNEDSEVRIEAYLAAVSCPKPELAGKIADILNSETIYQVGGFITSHLRGIRDSTDPTREAARHYLGNIRITKKFPIDPRRYSFNSELSYALDSLGVGASADYNLIYSQHGFLPRSGRLNLTSEVFGKRFNVLEFSARQENMESALEYYFGPKGYLNEHPQELINKLTAGFSRQKRSVSDEATKFSKNYKPYGGKINNDINLDLSIKMFGSEFFFLSLGDDIPTTADELNKQIMKAVSQGKEGVKNCQHSWQYHSLFMDTEIVYPSGIGFPIELVAQGTAAGSLDVASNINVEDIYKDPLNSKARVKVVPSVNININGQLRVIGSLVSTGVRCSTNLHSAAGSDVNLQLLNDGNEFNLDIELPRRNIDLVELKHDIEFFVADREKESKSFPMKHKKKASTHPGQFDQLEMFGLTVDYTATVPEMNAGSLPIMLTGPIHVALKLESEKKINLKGIHTKTETLESWQLTYDTPGSKVPHTSSLKFELGSSLAQPNSKIYARAEFANPKKHMAVEAGGVDNEQEFAVYGQYEHDTEKATAKVGFTKHGQEYRPIIQTISSKDNQPRNEIAGYKADGRVIVEKAGDSKKYKFENFRVVQPKGDAVVLNGWASMEQYKAETDLEISSNGQKYNVKALGSIAPGSYRFHGYLTDVGTGTTHGGELDLKVDEGIVEAHGNLKAGEHNFDLHQKYEWEKRGEEHTPHSVKFENELTLKNKNDVAGAIKLNGHVQANHFKYDFAGSRQDKKIAFFIDFMQDDKNPSEFKLDVNGKLNQHFIDIKSKSDVKGGKAHVDNTVTSSWGTQLTAKGVVGPRYSVQDVDIDLQGTIVLTSKDKPTNWILKAEGSPEKTTGEFKMNRENADIIAFTLEMNRPGDKPMNGKVNLSVKDNLVAKGDFKMAKNGRGDLSILVNMKKVGKKIKADSKFTIQAPKYDIETTIYFDPDKDKNKKVYYKTENIVDKQKFSTKNIFEFGQEKYAFDASGVNKGKDWKIDGEMDYKFVFTLPSGRQIDGDFHRKASTKSGLSDGIGVLNLNDKLTSNQKRSFTLKANFDNFDPKAKTLTITHNIIFTNFDGKNAEVMFVLTHLPKGHFKMIEVSFNAKGDLLEAPFEMNFNVDEYCEEHAVYRISGKYADKIDANINGNYRIGEEGKPSSYEIQVNMNCPNSNLKTIAIQSSGKLTEPKDPKGVHDGEIHYYHKIGENDPFKFDASAKGNEDHGSYHVETHIPKHSPIKMDGTYQQEETDKSAKYQYTLNYDYEGGKVIKTSVDLQTVDDDVINFHYTLETPYESAKHVDLIFKGKKSNEDTYTSSSQLNYNGQNYGLNTVVTLSERKTGIDITSSCPDKTSKISTNLETFGEKKGQASLVLENIGDLNFIGSAEVGFENYEDFYLKVDLDSAKLKLNQFHIEATSQKGGKGVTFLVKDQQQQIISGTATYNVKHEKGKAIVEGQGSVQYYQKTTNANFKLVRQAFDMSADKEAGFSYTFNGSFGPKNIVSALKVTTKNFHVKLASCEDKKQCTNFEVQSVVTIPDQHKPDHIQHEVMVLIDLRELGYPHEFELQSKTTRSGFKVEHEIEANVISNSNNKYQFIANLKPNSNVIQVKLPKRDIVIESKHVAPQKSLFGHYEESVTFYFDQKNKPNEKTQLLISGDVNGVENVAVNAKGSAKFEHPTIRPLQILGQVELNKDKKLAQSQVVFDVFKVPNQKVVAVVKYQGSESGERGFNVTAESSLKSAGLGFDYTCSGHSALSLDRREISAGATFIAAKADMRAGVYLYCSKERFEMLVNALNNEILAINANYQKNKAKIDSKIKILGSKPLTLSGEAEPSKLGFVLKQENLFQVTGELKPSKEIKFIVNGGGKKLYNGRIALDPAHFLATQYEVNQEDITEFVKTVEEQIHQDTKHARDNIDKQFNKVRQIIEHQIESMKSSTPDLSKLQASYEEHLTGILKELEEDPVLKDFVGVYRRTYEQFMKALQEFIKTVSASFEKSHKAATELYAKLSAAIKDQILPEIQAYFKRVTTEIGQLYVEAVKILGTSMEQALKTLKSIESDLGKMGKPIQELMKPIAELINEFIKSFGKEWEDLWKEVENYYKTLPSMKEMYQQIKQKLEEVTIFEEILPLANEAINQIQEYIATDEGKEFFAKLHEYIDAKLRRADVNDMEKLEELYSALLNAIRSFIMSVQGDGVQSGFFQPMPYTVEALKQLPGWITFKFSPFNFLRNENVESFTDIFKFHPLLDILPPYDLEGTIADGEHIFTFDGRHIAFPGTCKYVLAQDYVNNNFSVIANLKDGKMKSIVLVDKSNFVEVNDQGVIKLNGQPTEYPVHKEDIHAWRRYYSISLLSSYGAFVLCSTDLRVCHVKINGFYTAKTRGLLGNGNAEPNDDFTQPNGIVAENYATFGNSYGLGNCPPVAPQTHEHAKSPICKELFDIDSTLVLGYLFIDPAPYRQACEHAVEKAANKDEAACNIATAYASAAKINHVPIAVPNQCMKCNANTAEQRDIGTIFESKVPGNKADIVFVVDTAIGKDALGNLITPVIQDLRTQLKNRGIPDVHVAVIGYDHAQKWANLFTTHGKINFQGNLNNVNIDGPKHETIDNVGEEKLDKIIEKLRENHSKALYASDSKAFNLAMDYPFRAGASKAIVAVRSDNLEYGNPLKAFGAAISNELAKAKGISLHLIGPVKGLTVEGMAPEKIVGFNARVLATPEGRDAKKRSKLHYSSDMGVDIVHADGGWIFALQNFEQQKSPEQKKAFAQSISSNIAEQTSKLEVISECHCKLAYGLHPEEDCLMKSSQYLTAKKPAAARG